MIGDYFCNYCNHFIRDVFFTSLTVFNEEGKIIKEEEKAKALPDECPKCNKDANWKRQFPLVGMVRLKEDIKE